MRNSTKRPNSGKRQWFS